MRKIYLLILINLIFTIISNAQQYKRIWTSVYTDSLNGSAHINDAVTDKNGNTYLTGYRIFDNDNYYQTHLFLLKVNSAGSTQWIRYFDNKRDSIDEGKAITTDTLGNIYVTGTRIDTFCNICTYRTKISDIITLKYDSLGNRKWLNRYHDSTYHLATPSDIIQKNGAVVITGNISAYNSVTGQYDETMVVLKIKTNGQSVWVQKLPAIVASSACFMNTNNNIVVAAAADPYNYYLEQKPMVLKFSADGDLLWSRIFDENRKNGKMYFVRCDSLNNIYANGQTDTMDFFNVPKIVTIKYASDGTRKWVRKEDERTYVSEGQGDFKVDNAGNSYLTGYLEKTDINEDWLIVKYNNHGDLVWRTAFDDAYHSSDVPAALVIDNAGHTFVSGYVYSAGGHYSIATIALNSLGAITDTDIYKGAPKNDGFAAGIGIDKNNNFYTSGAFGSFNNPYPNLVVIKYGLRHAPALKNEVIAEQLNVSLFPNPAKNYLNISFTSSIKNKDYKCFVYDVSGNLFQSANMNNIEGKYNVQINTGNLHPGLYTLKISDGINVVSRTFLKE